MVSKFQKNLFIIITILVTVAILFSLSFRIIPTGHTGILVTFGKAFGCGGAALEGTGRVGRPPVLISGIIPVSA